MKIDNARGLPRELERAVLADGYERGEWRKSLTQLMAPLRMEALRERHADEIVEDAADRIWYTVARGVIAAMETNKDEDDLVLSEERITVSALGWSISTEVKQQVLKPDDTITVRDVRVSTARVASNPPEEWETLACLQAFLVRAAKSTHQQAVIGKVETVVVIRDWTKSMAAADPEYPQSPVVVIEYKPWNTTKALDALHGRILAFQKMEAELALGGELPLCSPSERWTTAGDFAVVKKGAKRASRTFSTRDGAAEYVSTHPGTEILVREGKPMRCGLYCAASPFCSQYQAELKQEITE